MAKIGLKYPCYAVASESGSTITYLSGANLAKAVDANVSIDTADVKLYADDAIRESDFSFTGGTVSFTIDDLSDAAKVAILGYTEGSEVDAVLGTKELSTGSANAPVAVGFGFYGKKKIAGSAYWRAIWLKKVVFKEPADAFTTKGQSTEFQTTALEGLIHEACDGKWKEEGTFATEAKAKAWLEGKAGISSAVSNNITVLALSNGTFTPTPFAEGTYLYSCAVTGTTTTVTATFAAGTAKLYVDGTYNQTLTTEVASSAVSTAHTSSHIFEIVVQESGKSAITYTIMVQHTA